MANMFLSAELFFRGKLGIVNARFCNVNDKMQLRVARNRQRTIDLSITRYRFLGPRSGFSHRAIQVLGELDVTSTSSRQKGVGGLRHSLPKEGSVGLVTPQAVSMVS